MKGNINYQYYLEKAITFKDYYDEQECLLERVNKGEDIHYAEYLSINYQRLKRGVKTSKLSTELKEVINSLEEKLTWLIITEHWCGDAAQTLAFFNAVCEYSKGKIEIKIIYRDENLALMDQFLTNGSRSIPILIQLNANLNLTGRWGPRPAEAQSLAIKLREEGKNYSTDLHKWYAKDRSKSLDKEIRYLIINQFADQS